MTHRGPFQPLTLWDSVILWIGVCPGFGWGRVNFHKKAVELTQISQSDGLFDTMWCCARYLGRGAGWSRVICCPGTRWALGGEKIALCIFFLKVFLLLFSSSFAILLNCLSQPMSFCLFLLILLPIALRAGGMRERPHDSLLPAGPKPPQDLECGLWRSCSMKKAVRGPALGTCAKKKVAL